MSKKTYAKFGEALERFKSGKPVEMSPETRRLAKLALEASEKSKDEDPKVWAERLVNSMYGKSKKP